MTGAGLVKQCLLSFKPPFNLQFFFMKKEKPLSYMKKVQN
ncbi:hypothetical protein SIN_1036 [Streptococcus infantis SK1302]|uniref:Uncharacterized protein n=1 Tax=Streptococcus infantis SK1302 TaxID=871237 RepID=A0ABN0B4Y1_9STRE|nr:hypothetical protein SIN_1036 [Streptococcus infantis SK1302]